MAEEGLRETASRPVACGMGPGRGSSPVRCTAKAREIRSLMDNLQEEVPEFRRPQALGYPLPGLVCLMVLAAAQGVVRGPQDLAASPRP